MASSTNMKALLALVCLAAAATALPALKSQTLNSTGVAIKAINEVAARNPARVRADLAHEEFRPFYHGTDTTPRIQECTCTKYMDGAPNNATDYCEEFGTFPLLCYKYTPHCGLVPRTSHCHYERIITRLADQKSAARSIVARRRQVSCSCSFGSSSASCSGSGGTLAVALGGLQNCETTLTVLDLSGNKLDGTIPATISTLVQLTVLDFDLNGLTGTIPVQISALVKLQYLALDRNALTGTIPPQISTLMKLTLLSVPSNGLTGTIPAQISALVKLQYLYLEGSALTGTIPPQISSLTKLGWLYLEYTEIQPPICRRNNEGITAVQQFFKTCTAPPATPAPTPAPTLAPTLAPTAPVPTTLAPSSAGDPTTSAPISPSPETPGTTTTSTSNLTAIVAITAAAAVIITAIAAGVIIFVFRQRKAHVEATGSMEVLHQ